MSSLKSKKSSATSRSALELVKDMQRRIIEKNWEIMGLWWTRVEVRTSKIRNYDPMPSHWLNRRLEDVWLAEK